MSCGEYRLFLNNARATPAQLARFEDITVDQEMDMACEARLQVPLCLGSDGHWSGENDAFLQPMSRIRIEARIRGGNWVPLIDGPIVSNDSDMQSEPGYSMATVAVRDDTVLLHRDETVRVFKGESDDEIARQLFQSAHDPSSNQPQPDIRSVHTDRVPAANSGFDSTVLRGTQMELLQLLAQRQHMHAYVLPADSPGTSDGYFTGDPEGDSGLPTLRLIDSKDGARNVLFLKFSNRATKPAVFRTTTVSLNDISPTSRNANAGDIQRLGSNDPDGTPARRLLHPGLADVVDPQRAAQGASERAAYSYEGDGEVMRDVYPAVLRPYQNVQVLGVNGRLSGLWLITQVTHTLTRNSYGQTFRLARNAQSAGTGQGTTGVPAAIHS